MQAHLALGMHGYACNTDAGTNECIYVIHICTQHTAATLSTASAPKSPGFPSSRHAQRGYSASIECRYVLNACQYPAKSIVCPPHPNRAVAAAGLLLCSWLCCVSQDGCALVPNSNHAGLAKSLTAGLVPFPPQGHYANNGSLRT